MHSMSHPRVALLLAALLCSCAAHAQVNAPMFVAGRAQGVRALTPEQKQERQFLREAAAHLRFVRAASEMALQKSGDEHVRVVAAELLEHARTVQPEVHHMLHARAMAQPMQGNVERVLLASDPGLRAEYAGELARYPEIG